MHQHYSVALALIAVVSFGLSYLGAAVGLVLGQFRVVLLTYVLGSAAVAGATSLAISTMAALVGALVHARSGRVQPGLVATIGGPSALTAYFSTRYASRADPRMLKAAIATALLITGINMLRRKQSPAPAPALVPTSFDAPGYAFAGQVLVGAVLGAVSGLVGLLLGSLRLPAMIRWAHIAPATAVGTNMAIGAITGVSAGIAALLGDQVDFPALALVAPMTVIGAHFGARKTGLLSEATLTRWIAYALVPTALLMLVEVAFVR